jgi:hypothetical protein
MHTVEEVSLDSFRERVGKRDVNEPLLIEFEPRLQDVGETFHALRSRDHCGQNTQYLSSSHLYAGDLVQDGARLQEALDEQSVVLIRTGTWLSWPGMVSEFHRDWNLWSVLNFMFCGEKVWHIMGCDRITPHHANLVLSDGGAFVRDIEAGKYGYRIVQHANECVYLPGGFYHRVSSEAFCLSFSMWWTWQARLFQHRSITDTWWLWLLRNQRFLKPEHTATVQSAYWSRPALERAYCKHVYDRYLRVCNRMNTRRIQRFTEQSALAAQRMQSLLMSENLDAAARRAASMS